MNLESSESLETSETSEMSEAQAPALVVDHLRHAFKKHLAVDDVSFTVNRGAIHGFVGPNGAGKTTTLKVIATLLPPQKGVVRVFGQDIKRDVKNVRKRIGFMPDHFSMYRQMTVFEYLDFFAAAYGQGVSERNKTIEDVLLLTDMDKRRDDLIKGLSRGMQQRVSLARVLVHDPDLLLLDEPASGLDPRARIELMEILRELRRLGKTIFISSHILSELADLCDSVTIIDRGLIKFTGQISELLTHDSGTGVVTYDLVMLEPDEAVVERLRQTTGVINVVCHDHKPSYRIDIDESATNANKVLRNILTDDLKLVGFHRVQRHLNEAFMALTEAGVRS